MIKTIRSPQNRAELLPVAVDVTILYGDDHHDDIQQLLEDLDNGVYDYLIAYDDTRLARDDFFFVIRYSAIRGGAELQFVDDIDIQSLDSNATCG